MSDAIRTQVEKILSNVGVTFAAKFIGATTRDKWECDEWRCTFDKGGAAESFEFFTGIGHRKPNPSPMAQASARSLAKVSKRMIAWHDHYKRWPDIAQAPHPADVLTSLVLDSSAIGQSFESWCSDFGYDSDSRKAEGIYRACQQNADKFARVFDHVAREALTEALQDY